MAPTNVTLIGHPLVQHKLSAMRKRETASSTFRSLLREISFLMAYEVTGDLPVAQTPVETPLERCDAPALQGDWPALVSILRAGNVFLEGMMELLPESPIGHIGLYRDPETLTAVEYYCKLPQRLAERRVIVVDPMVATGNTAVAALDRLAEYGAREVCFVCLLAAPEGIARIRADYPDIRIYAASVDRQLDARGYIVPGLGDAGDRLYGTR